MIFIQTYLTNKCKKDDIKPRILNQNKYKIEINVFAHLQHFYLLMKGAPCGEVKMIFRIHYAFPQIVHMGFVKTY